MSRDMRRSSMRSEKLDQENGGGGGGVGVVGGGGEEEERRVTKIAFQTHELEEAHRATFAGY